MTQGDVRHDLVSGFAGPVARAARSLLDGLGEDPVGGALGDPYRGGDVTQADSRIMGDAGKDVGVIGQKVPAGD
jgi:hypothetical protein